MKVQKPTQNMSVETLGWVHHGAKRIKKILSIRDAIWEMSGKIGEINKILVEVSSYENDQMWIQEGALHLQSRLATREVLLQRSNPSFSNLPRKTKRGSSTRPFRRLMMEIYERKHPIIY